MEVSSLCFYLALLCIIYKVIDNWLRKHKLGELESKYILVTGCDTGFGHEFAKRLDKLGCHVFAGCLTEKGEDELRKVSSDRLVTLPLDVSDHECVIKAYQTVCNNLPHGKGLWGVANNAGIGGDMGPVEWIQISDYQQVLNVNTLGLIDVATTFLPLVKREHGRIVNVTSFLGRMALEEKCAYVMSKYASEAFSDCLRKQMKVFKVSVHIIEGGYVYTNIVNADNVAKLRRTLFDRCPKEIKEEFGEQYLNEAIAYTKENVKKMPTDKGPVLDAYEHAMLAKYPRARYVIGFDVNYVAWPVSVLPTVIGDRLLNLYLKKKPIPQACK